MNRFIRIEDAEKAIRNRICWERKDITKRDIEIRNECLEALIEALDEDDCYSVCGSPLKRGDGSG